MARDRPREPFTGSVHVGDQLRGVTEESPVQFELVLVEEFDLTVSSTNDVDVEIDGHDVIVPLAALV